MFRICLYNFIHYVPLFNVKGIFFSDFIRDLLPLTAHLFQLGGFDSNFPIQKYFRYRNTGPHFYHSGIVSWVSVNFKDFIDEEFIFMGKHEILESLKFFEGIPLNFCNRFLQIDIILFYLLRVI